MGINTCNRIWELMEKGDVDATASDVGATASDVDCRRLLPYEGIAFWRRFAGYSGAIGDAVQTPLEASFWLGLGGQSGIATSFWRRSPIRNAVQALEEDCSSRLRVPDACLASFSHHSDVVLAPLMTSFCDILKRW